MPNLFPNFLTDDSEYAKAEAFWATLWDSISEYDRKVAGWRSGWFKPEPPNDGNPIFTAVSLSLHKAIRIIQYAPTTDKVEIDVWGDTYGGSAIDPIAIRELVIACALSTESSQVARKYISSWVVGEIELTKAPELGHRFTNIRGSRPLWQQPIPDPDTDISAPTRANI